MGPFTTSQQSSHPQLQTVNCVQIAAECENAAGTVMQKGLEAVPRLCAGKG